MPPLFSEIAISEKLEETQDNKANEIDDQTALPSTNEISIEIDNPNEIQTDLTNNSITKENVDKKENDESREKTLPEEIVDSNNFQDIDLNQTFSLDDPVDILITFFYTSHIDITQKNVTSLKTLATQCAMDDVITACDEFSKVLIAETEHLTTDEEKDEVASKFRYRYSDPAMPTKILHHLDELRKQKKYVDLVLESSPNQIRYDVHSVVVASASQFFEHVIANESKVDALQMTDIHEDVLESMIAFLYSGKVEVNQSNALKLIQASDCLQQKDLTEGCAEFFELITSVQNCIRHLSVAFNYKCEKLKVREKEIFIVLFF